MSPSKSPLKSQAISAEDIFPRVHKANPTTNMLDDAISQILARMVINKNDQAKAFKIK